MANAKAVVNGQADFETTIGGKKWPQPVFPYQAKCLETLRQADATLTSDDKQALDNILSGTGCEILFKT